MQIELNRPWQWIVVCLFTSPICPSCTPPHPPTLKGISSVVNVRFKRHMVHKLLLSCRSSSQFLPTRSQTALYSAFVAVVVGRPVCRSREPTLKESISLTLTVKSCFLVGWKAPLASGNNKNPPKERCFTLQPPYEGRCRRSHFISVTHCFLQHPAQMCNIGLWDIVVVSLWKRNKGREGDITCGWDAAWLNRAPGCAYADLPSQVLAAFTVCIWPHGSRPLFLRPGEDNGYSGRGALAKVSIYHDKAQGRAMVTSATGESSPPTYKSSV